MNQNWIEFNLEWIESNKDWIESDDGWIVTKIKLNSKQYHVTSSQLTKALGWSGSSRDFFI